MRALGALRSLYGTYWCDLLRRGPAARAGPNKSLGILRASMRQERRTRLNAPHPLCHGRPATLMPHQYQTRHSQHLFYVMA